ncbi:MAG: haloacid dehalogenase type II [Sulfuricaulis sp.]|uniref:haloacid dehalogenase type II n=1 Tax=Sulfuricaulis sp. TaxID=2003553 RepID=UPI0034A5836B
MNTKRDLRAILFDLFGTVLDWRGSIIDELAKFGKKHRYEANWSEFADRWRAGFRTFQSRIAKGETSWMTMDEIHRSVLDRLLKELAVPGLKDEEISNLNSAWHRLRPWPDAVEGIVRLKRQYMVSPLSNGNLSMLIAASKHAGLPWDCVLSSAMFASYKPDPKVYRGAASLLGLATREVMLVAAHAYDTDGARAIGFKTSYVFRPEEFGPGRGEDPGDTSRFDFVAADFLELAAALGA